MRLPGPLSRLRISIADEYLLAGNADILASVSIINGLCMGLLPSPIAFEVLGGPAQRRKFHGIRDLGDFKVLLMMIDRADHCQLFLPSSFGPRHHTLVYLRLRHFAGLLQKIKIAAQMRLRHVFEKQVAVAAFVLRRGGVPRSLPLSELRIIDM